MCTSSANFDRKYYTLLTPKMLTGVLNQLSKKDTGYSSYKILTGVKGAKIFDLVMLNTVKPMPEDVFDLKYRAVQLDAYIHPGWDYFKYPLASLKMGYSKAQTNEVFEEVDTDYYGDAICVYIGRNEVL